MNINGSMGGSNPEITGKRKSEETSPETKTGQPRKKIFKFESPPAQEAWSGLCDDVKLIVLQKLYEEGGIKELIALRETNRENKYLVDALIPIIFRDAFRVDKPSNEYLKSLNEPPQLYENSSSQPFLNTVLYHHDSKTSFEIWDERPIDSRFFYPSRKLYGQLSVLDTYRTHFESKGIKSRPTAIQCDLVEDYHKVEDFYAHYQKLKPLLTEDLEEFELFMSSAAFDKILKSEKGELESSGVIGKFLFGQTFPNLTDIKLTLHIGIIPDTIDLTEKDVYDLEKCAPNLKRLDLSRCSVGESFARAFKTSSLESKLYICFNQSDFRNIGNILFNTEI